MSTNVTFLHVHFRKLEYVINCCVVIEITLVGYTVLSPRWQQVTTKNIILIKNTLFVWQTSGAEQRLKQLQEELKCQRQNAESSRLQHQQRSKELEKQHQRVRWK